MRLDASQILFRAFPFWHFGVKSPAVSLFVAKKVPSDDLPV
jgi:hypothetical protein